MALKFDTGPTWDRGVAILSFGMVRARLLVDPTHRNEGGSTMGLLDEGAELRRQADFRKLHEQEAQEARYRPWSSDWTRELASILSARRYLMAPLYVRGTITEPIRRAAHWERELDVAFWGDAWLLMGWRDDSGGDYIGVNVALRDDGTLWKLDTLWDITLDHLNATKAPRDNHVIFRRGILSGHRHIVELSARPETAVRYKTDGDVLRKLVGVPIAAAIGADVRPNGFRIVADQTPGLKDYYR